MAIQRRTKDGITVIKTDKNLQQVLQEAVAASSEAPVDLSGCVQADLATLKAKTKEKPVTVVADKLPQDEGELDG
jgi:hypothetical protein